MLEDFDLTAIHDLEGARQAIARLLNLVEDLASDLREAQAENQRLRDEINRLKGEQGQPQIKANKKPEASAAPRDYSSESERKKPRARRKKGSKVAQLHIDREVTRTVDRATLPPDAEFKGHEPVVIQDLQIKTDNILFHKEKFYSLAGSALLFAWRLMGIFEATRRVIPQPNGAPLIITEQRASLEEHLPNFLRWLAWFLETRQVIVDQEKNMYPVTVLHGGRAESPKLTDDDRQERVARRRQFTQAVAAMAGGGGEGVVHEAQTLAAGQDPVSLPVPEGGQVVDGEYRIVEPAQLSGWLAEVRAQLPEDDRAQPQAQ